MRLFALVAVVAVGACAPVPPPAETPSENQCRASEYRYLIGQNRSQIPATPPGATWRVTCVGCPVTMDYSPSRLNILYDERSGVIREVSCG